MKTYNVPGGNLQQYICTLVATRFPEFDEWYNKEHGTNATFEFHRKE